MADEPHERRQRQRRKDVVILEGDAFLSRSLGYWILEVATDDSHEGTVPVRRYVLDDTGQRAEWIEYSSHVLRGISTEAVLRTSAFSRQRGTRQFVTNVGGVSAAQYVFSGDIRTEATDDVIVLASGRIPPSDLSDWIQGLGNRVFEMPDGKVLVIETDPLREIGEQRSRRGHIAYREYETVETNGERRARAIQDPAYDVPRPIPIRHMPTSLMWQTLNAPGVVSPGVLKRIHTSRISAPPAWEITLPTSADQHDPARQLDVLSVWLANNSVIAPKEIAHPDDAARWAWFQRGRAYIEADDKLIVVLGTASHDSPLPSPLSQVSARVFDLRHTPQGTIATTPTTVDEDDEQTELRRSSSSMPGFELTPRGLWYRLHAPGVRPAGVVDLRRGAFALHTDIDIRHVDADTPSTRWQTTTVSHGGSRVSSHGHVTGHRYLQDTSELEQIPRQAILRDTSSDELLVLPPTLTINQLLAQTSVDSEVDSIPVASYHLDHGDIVLTSSPPTTQQRHVAELAAALLDGRLQYLDEIPRPNPVLLDHAVRYPNLNGQWLALQAETWVSHEPLADDADREAVREDMRQAVERRLESELGLDWRKKPVYGTEASARMLGAADRVDLQKERTLRSFFLRLTANDQRFAANEPALIGAWAATRRGEIYRLPDHSHVMVTHVEDGKLALRQLHREITDVETLRITGTTRSDRHLSPEQTHSLLLQPGVVLVGRVPQSIAPFVTELTRPSSARDLLTSGTRYSSWNITSMEPSRLPPLLPKAIHQPARGTADNTVNIDLKSLLSLMELAGETDGYLSRTVTVPANNNDNTTSLEIAQQLIDQNLLTSVGVDSNARMQVRLSLAGLHTLRQGLSMVHEETASSNLPIPPSDVLNFPINRLRLLSEIARGERGDRAALAQAINDSDRSVTRELRRGAPLLTRQLVEISDDRAHATALGRDVNARVESTLRTAAENLPERLRAILRFPDTTATMLQRDFLIEHTPLDVEILLNLATSPGIRPEELARRTQTQWTTVRRALYKMKEQGLVMTFRLGSKSKGAEWLIAPNGMRAVTQVRQTLAFGLKSLGAYEDRSTAPRPQATRIDLRHALSVLELAGIDTGTTRTFDADGAPLLRHGDLQELAYHHPTHGLFSPNQQTKSNYEWTERGIERLDAVVGWAQRCAPLIGRPNMSMSDFLHHVEHAEPPDVVDDVWSHVLDRFGETDLSSVSFPSGQEDPLAHSSTHHAPQAEQTSVSVRGASLRFTKSQGFDRPDVDASDSGATHALWLHEYASKVFPLSTEDGSQGRSHRAAAAQRAIAGTFNSLFGTRWWEQDIRGLNLRAAYRHLLERRIPLRAVDARTISETFKQLSAEYPDVVTGFASEAERDQAAAEPTERRAWDPPLPDAIETVVRHMPNARSIRRRVAGRDDVAIRALEVIGRWRDAARIRRERDNGPEPGRSAPPNRPTRPPTNGPTAAERETRTQIAPRTRDHADHAVDTDNSSRQTDELEELSDRIGVLAAERPQTDQAGAERSRITRGVDTDSRADDLEDQADRIGEEAAFDRSQHGSHSSAERIDERLADTRHESPMHR